MDICSRCGKSEEEVKLFDGIYLTETLKICERCSLINRIPIIKRPNPDQLRISEKPYSVRERLTHLAGLPGKEHKEKTVEEEIEELDETPKLHQPEDIVFKLVDNFHWVIQRERRRKGLSAKQLADMIGESLSAINMLEKGIVPSNSIVLITKIEQFLNIGLVKKDIFKILEEKKMKENEKIETMQKYRQIGEIEEFKPDLKSEIDETPLSFTKSEAESLSIRELQRMNKIVEQDFPKKNAFEVGEEQVEDFGKEKIPPKFYPNTRNPDKKVPTIYELMKEKAEKEKTSILGKDIELDENQ